MAYTSGTKHQDNYKRNYESQNPNRRFVHEKFTLEHEKIKVSCDKDGKVTLQSDNDDDTFDEITIPASLVFKIAMMLEMTRSIVYVTEGEKKRSSYGIID